MKKRNYEKPSMKVVVLSKQPHLLAGSGVTSTGGFGGYYFETGSSYDYLNGYGLGEGGDL